MTFEEFLIAENLNLSPLYKATLEKTWNAAQEQQQQTIKDLAEALNELCTLRRVIAPNYVHPLEALAAQHLNTEEGE